MILTRWEGGVGEGAEEKAAAGEDRVVSVGLTRVRMVEVERLVRRRKEA